MSAAHVVEQCPAVARLDEAAGRRAVAQGVGAGLQVAEQRLAGGEATRAVGARQWRTGRRGGGQQAVTRAQVKAHLLETVAVEGSRADGALKARLGGLLEMLVHMGFDAREQHLAGAVSARVSLRILQKVKDKSHIIVTKHLHLNPINEYLVEG